MISEAHLQVLEPDAAAKFFIYHVSPHAARPGLEKGLWQCDVDEPPNGGVDDVIVEKEPPHNELHKVRSGPQFSSFTKVYSPNAKDHEQVIISANLSL